MTIQRMEHVGIVVDDLAAAIEFFAQLGLEPQGEGEVEGRWVDRVVGLEGVRVEFAMMQTPAFAVEGIDAVVASLRARGGELVGELENYEDTYRLCYVRGPEGSSSSWLSESANRVESVADFQGFVAWEQFTRGWTRGLSHVRLTPTMKHTVARPLWLTGRLPANATTV